MNQNTHPQTSELYLLEDLEDASKTTQLAKNDLAALSTVADWIKCFVARPHKDLDREGPVCPDPKSYAKRFSNKYLHRTIRGGIGHNLPQEAPEAFVDAIVEVDGS